MSPRNNAVCKCFASFTCGNAFCSIVPHATGRTAYYTAPIKALFARVRLAALEHTRELGNLDENWGHGERAWEAALDDYFAEHNEIRLDGDARSVAYLSIDESTEAEQHLWHVRQIFLDENADGDFRIETDVNLDATQEEGEIIFKNYRVGFVEDLAE